jgi:hypothetical protein
MKDRDDYQSYFYVVYCISYIIEMLCIDVIIFLKYLKSATHDSFLICIHVPAYVMNVHLPTEV